MAMLFFRGFWKQGRGEGICCLRCFLERNFLACQAGLFLNQTHEKFKA